jgi:hypothetical protein
MAKDLGFLQADFDQALSTLSSPSLDRDEQQILAWTRVTVHFQPGNMQRRIKSMAKEIDENFRIISYQILTHFCRIVIVYFRIISYQKGINDHIFMA